MPDGNESTAIMDAFKPLAGVVVGWGLAYLTENRRQKKRRIESSIKDTWRALGRAAWALDDHFESGKEWADHLSGREDDEEFWRVVNADRETCERAIHEAFSELELQLHALPNELRSPAWGPLVKAVSKDNLPDSRKRLLTDDIYIDERTALKAFKAELSEKARAALGGL